MLKYSNRYIRVLLPALLFILLIRTYELTIVLVNFGNKNHLLLKELTGYFNDVLVFNLIAILVFPVFLFLEKMLKHKVGLVFTNVFFIVFLVCSAYVVKYFLYQFQPLDIFVFNYSLKEMWFTVSTVQSNLVVYFLGSILFVFLFLFVQLRLRLLEFSRKSWKYLWPLSFLLLLIYALLPGGQFGKDVFSTNKTYFFLKKSVQYAFRHETSELIDADVKTVRKLIGKHKYLRSDFPLLHTFDRSDVLGNFLTKANEAPNIVVLIIEGLNDDFIHDFHGVHLMPFTESLRAEGLYWERAFCLGERSFAVVPSALGGLPYGEKGFTLLDNYPYHFSLVNVLNSNSYFTSFFYGQGSWFHKKNKFFRYNRINLNVDNSKFADKYEKIIVGDDNFFWGYNDKALFSNAISVIDTLNVSRLFSCYYTGSMHSPFIISEPESYDQRLFEKISRVTNSDDSDFLIRNKDYLRTTIFTDDALRDFFKQYAKRKDFDRTIFIITGDHPMTEVPITNSLKRYHVPLIIYSPLVKSPRVFPGVVSQLDVYETILAYLYTNYKIDVPELSSSLGAKLDTSSRLNMEKDVVFMNTNREIIDYYSSRYFISNEKDLFNVDEQFDLTLSRDTSKFEEMSEKLKAFRNMNHFISTENKLLPEEDYLRSLKYQIKFDSIQHDTMFNKEYWRIIPKVPVNRHHLYYKIAVDLADDNTEEKQIVYQLKNSSDSLISWNSIKFSTDIEKMISVEFPEGTDSLFFFSSYFWNREKREIQFNECRATLYQNQKY